MLRLTALLALTVAMFATAGTCQCAQRESILAGAVLGLGVCIQLNGKL